MCEHFEVMPTSLENMLLLLLMMMGFQYSHLHSKEKVQLMVSDLKFGVSIRPCYCARATNGYFTDISIQTHRNIEKRVHKYVVKCPRLPFLFK